MWVGRTALDRSPRDRERDRDRDRERYRERGWRPGGSLQLAYCSLIIAACLLQLIAPRGLAAYCHIWRSDGSGSPSPSRAFPSVTRARALSHSPSIPGPSAQGLSSYLSISPYLPIPLSQALYLFLSLSRYLSPYLVALPLCVLSISLSPRPHRRQGVGGGGLRPPLEPVEVRRVS